MSEETEFRITKIAAKKEKITICSESSYNGELIESTLSCGDTPNPDFYKALADMGKAMCDVVKMQNDWAEGHQCRGVSIDYSDDNNGQIGQITTLWIPTPHLGGGITINTPRMIQRVQGAKGGSAYMSDKVLAALEILIKEAEKYRDGDRAQQSLVGAANSNSEAEPEEGEAAED